MLGVKYLTFASPSHLTREIKVNNKMITFSAIDSYLHKFFVIDSFCSRVIVI